MAQQQIIRHVSPLDRPVTPRVTREEVIAIARSLPDGFSTRDIADKIMDSGSHRGLSYDQIEYAVRAAVGWLLKSKWMEPSKAKAKRYTKETNHMYWAETYVFVEHWGPPDLAALNRIFLGVMR